MYFMTWIKALRVPKFQLGDDDIVVFVVGPSGSGKSTFVEQVTRSDFVKIGTSLRPCTARVQATRYELTEGAKASLGVTKQKNIVFVDTPSFHSLQRDEAAAAEMRSWLAKSKSKSTLVGTIYMHRIETDPRYEPIQPHLNAFAHTFPPHFLFLPRRLHAVLSYEGVISEGTISLRREMFEAQLRTLHPSRWFAERLKWDVSLHPNLFRPGDPETAWQAVEALVLSLTRP